MKTRLQYCLRVVTTVVAAHLVFAIWVASVHAYATWSDGCQDCHGDFNSGTYVSQTDGTSWGTNLMSGHSAFMGSGTCNVCHEPERFPVFIGLSAGISGYSPISCLGCHGRAADAVANACVSGDAGTIDPANCGMGAGLRAHHTAAGVTGCADCHSDGTPAGENVAPPYYFTPDTAHPNKPTNACNADPPPGNENKFGSLGLDNDGDGLYDGNDADCQSAGICGDGITSGAEDCDDGDTNWQPGEYCNGECHALACGDTNDSQTLTASDALFALRAAVGSSTCDLSVCDVNDSGAVRASDALIILNKAVGAEITLVCPAPL